VILCGIILFLVSPFGFNITLNLVSHVLPGKLTYQRASGSLAKSLTFTKFEYKNQYIDIKSDYLHITWSSRKLIRRELAINTIRANNVNIAIYHQKTKPTSSTATNTLIQFSPLHLSWAITIKDAAISHVKLKSDLIKKVLHIPLIHINGIVSQSKIDLTLNINHHIENHSTATITLKGQLNDYRLQADYQNILKKQYYTVKAVGNQTHLSAELNTQSKKTNTLEMNGEAYVSWNKQLTWRGNFNALNLPLTDIKPLYPLSRAAFDLTFDGSFDGSILNQKITFSNLTFWLTNGTQFNGHVHVTQQANIITAAVNVQNKNDYLTLNASLNHFLNLSWKLHMDNLSDIAMTRQ
jgi:hypothetical protein